MTFTFDWQAEARKSRGSFLEWLIPELVTCLEWHGKSWELIRERSKGYTDVQLTIQINGVEVDPKSFLEGVESNMTHQAQRGAEELVGSITDLEALHDSIDELASGVRDKVRELLRANGIEPRDEWD